MSNIIINLIGVADGVEVFRFSVGPFDSNILAYAWLEWFGFKPTNEPTFAWRKDVVSYFEVPGVFQSQMAQSITASVVHMYSIDKAEIATERGT